MDNFRNLRRWYLFSWSLKNYNRKYGHQFPGCITEGHFNVLYAIFTLNDITNKVTLTGILGYLKKSYKSMRNKYLRSRITDLLYNELIIQSKHPSGYNIFRISAKGHNTLIDFEKYCRKARPPRLN